MKTSRGSVQLKLTLEQQAQIRRATGQTADTLELSIEDHEERIVPGTRMN
jgi:hypothetical protein